MSTAESLRTRVAAFMRPLLLGGPVGAYYAVRLAWLRWRIANVVEWRQRENDVHREHVRVLNQELTDLVDAEQRVNVAAAQYWKALGRTGAGS